MIATSSSADLPLDYFERHDIPFLCYSYVIDGKEYADDLFQTQSAAEFYGKIDAGAMPTTSQINVARYIDFLEPFLAQGTDVLFLELSHNLSGAYQNALTAARELREKYPERSLHILDCLCLSGGQGMLLDAMVDLRDSGASMDDIHSWVLENRLRLQAWGFTTDLSHFKRGGRISTASAVISGLLNIYPVLLVNREGQLLSGKKLRGKKNAFQEMLTLMEAHAENGRDYSGKCFVSHSDREADANELAKLVAANFPKVQQPILVHTIGGVLGSHSGPGTVAFFFWGDERLDSNG